MREIGALDLSPATGGTGIVIEAENAASVMNVVFDSTKATAASVSFLIAFLREYLPPSSPRSLLRRHRCNRVKSYCYQYGLVFPEIFLCKRDNNHEQIVEWYWP